jgi:hypothetical protein
MTGRLWACQDRFEKLQLSETDEAPLERLVRSRTTAQRVVERCRIVLASAAGQKSEEICAAVGVSKPTVKTWLDRFEASGISGLLQDLPRSGRPPEIAPEKIAGGGARDAANASCGHRDPLEPAHAGTGCRREPFHRRADLEGAWAEAASGGNLQDLEGSTVRGEAPRCDGPLPLPARAGRGVLGRCEDADPGARPHPQPGLPLKKVAQAR